MSVQYDGRMDPGEHGWALHLLYRCADGSIADFLISSATLVSDAGASTYERPTQVAKKVAAEAKAHPDWFSYLYTQAEEYAKLKGVCAAHALAGTTPPGVATIEIACEALKLAEWLTPELQKKLKK